MYYLKQIKCHIYYLLTKKNIIVISILNIGLIIYSLIISGTFTNASKIDSNRLNYYNNYISNFFLFVELLYLFIIVFINITFYNKDYEKYAEFFIKNNKSKIEFYITRFLTLLIFNFLELILFILVFYIILFTSRYGRNYSYFLKIFIDLYILGSFYSIVSSFMMTLFKTYLSSLIVLILFFFSFIYTSFYTLENEIKNIVLFVIPILDPKLLNLNYGVFHVLLYSIIFTLLMTFYLFKKDGI